MDDAKEKQKLYYAQYYKENRDRILAMATKKVECEFCHRKINNYSLERHYKTAYCVNKTSLLKDLQERRNAAK